MGEKEEGRGKKRGKKGQFRSCCFVRSRYVRKSDRGRQAHSPGACESEFLKRVRGARATRLVNCMFPTLRGVKRAEVEAMVSSVRS